MKVDVRGRRGVAHPRALRDHVQAIVRPQQEQLDGVARRRAVREPRLVVPVDRRELQRAAGEIGQRLVDPAAARRRREGQLLGQRPLQHRRAVEQVELRVAVEAVGARAPGLHVDEAAQAQAVVRLVTDFEPKTAAKRLMREARSGALATLMAGSGDPYCSLVNVASAADGTPLLLISRLAIHTKNILADPRVSLMLDERKPGDPLQGARVMLAGAAIKTASEEAKRRYLTRQPEAEIFVGFDDFVFYEVKLKGAHLVAGFGRIVDLQPADLLTDLAGAERWSLQA